MAKKPVKKRQPDYQQLSRKILDTVSPDAEPKSIKPAKNPATPKRKQDAADIDRAAGEGMVTQPHEKNPAAVSLGRLGGLKGGKARADKLTEQERHDIAKRAARARWKKPKRQG